MGIGILPAAIAISMRVTIPETPRYYAVIMKDLRKAVKNTLMVYHKDVSEKTPRAADITAATRQGSGEEAEARWYEWTMVYRRLDVFDGATAGLEGTGVDVSSLGPTGRCLLRSVDGPG